MAGKSTAARRRPRRRFVPAVLTRRAPRGRTGDDAPCSSCSGDDGPSGRNGAVSYPYQATPDPTAVVGRRVVATLVDGLVIAGPATAIAAAELDLQYLDEADLQVPSDQFCELLRDQSTTSVCVDAGDRVYFSDNTPVLGWVTGLVLSVALLVLLQGLKGVTPGKALMGIRTAGADGRAPGLGKALVRWLLLIVDTFPWCAPLLGFILALSTNGHQRLGDKAASTFVVDKAAFGQPLHVPGTATGAPAYAGGGHPPPRHPARLGAGLRAGWGPRGAGRPALRPPGGPADERPPRPRRLGALHRRDGGGPDRRGHGPGRPRGVSVGFGPVGVVRRGRARGAVLAGAVTAGGRHGHVLRPGRGHRPARRAAHRRDRGRPGPGRRRRGRRWGRHRRPRAPVRRVAAGHAVPVRARSRRHRGGRPLRRPGAERARSRRHRRVGRGPGPRRRPGRHGGRRSPRGRPHDDRPRVGRGRARPGGGPAAGPVQPAVGRRPGHLHRLGARPGPVARVGRQRQGVAPALTVASARGAVFGGKTGRSGR